MRPRPAPPGPERPIVFLHVPKTAGQAVHHALAGLVPAPAVSPVRTHTQAADRAQMPPGYSLYSGHIDWQDLDSLPPARFVFTVLRDPRERLASFYFFLRAQAQEKAAAGKGAPGEDVRRILEGSVDCYFMDPQPGWQRFVRDHFDNFFCSYFATRRIRGRAGLEGLSPAEAVARAEAGLAGLDAVYSTGALAPLEDEIRRRYGVRIRVAGRYRNVGSLPQDRPRWPELLALAAPATRERLESFVALDEALLGRIRPAAGAAGLRGRLGYWFSRSRW